MPPGPVADALHDVDVLLQSRYGLVRLDSPDPDRTALLLRHLADRKGLPLFRWTRSRGLARTGTGAPEGAVYETRELEAALRHVGAARVAALYHFHGVEGEMVESAVLVDRLAEATGVLEGLRGAIVLTGPAPGLPPELERRCATVRVPGPGSEEFRNLLTHIVRDLSERRQVEVALEPDDVDGLVRHLAGLTLMEAEKILTKAIVEDGRLSPDDIRHVIDAKKTVVEREGLLEYYPVEESLADVADLAMLKGWLAKRKEVVARPARAREFGLTFPRGVLLLGVPGCGKSLCAKAVATEWRLPLLRLDPSGLYNKYIGETEKNFKRAMETAERMAPVVLWVDELEKAFARGGAEDGGVAQRVLGTFLSWMQERKADVFVVATANDIERLPPEFLRKGRFDEIFFVDLPDPGTRERIFRIHLEARGRDADGFGLSVLAEATEGFSGAEIEQVVLAGLYSAFTDGGALTTEGLLSEAAGTRPLSVTMAERIAAMRSWARGRTVLAN